MNKDIVKEIKTSIDDNVVDNELSKSIIVKVDKGLLDYQTRITNELIDIGYDEIYTMLTKRLNETVKYLKKVNLDKPFKQNAFGKFFEIDIEVDLLSSTTMLFEDLRHMIYLLPLFNNLFDRLDEVEHELMI